MHLSPNQSNKSVPKQQPVDRFEKILCFEYHLTWLAQQVPPVGLGGQNAGNLFLEKIRFYGSWTDRLAKRKFSWFRNLKIIFFFFIKITNSQLQDRLDYGRWLSGANAVFLPLGFFLLLLLLWRHANYFYDFLRNKLQFYKFRFKNRIWQRRSTWLSDSEPARLILIIQKLNLVEILT